MTIRSVVQNIRMRGPGLFRVLFGLSLLIPVHAEIVDRQRDPVVIKLDVSKIPRWIDQGHQTASFELWKYTSSGWQIAPFQIDEYVDANPMNVRPFIESSEYADRRVCNGTGPSLPPAGNGPCEFLYDLREKNQPAGNLSEMDELVFLAGSTGRCDAPLMAWPSVSSHDNYRQKIVVEDDVAGNPERGCLYLFRRTSGAAVAPPDLIDYNPAGDGVPATCVPHADACGAIVGMPVDFDSDGTDDLPAYRADYLGNWSMDRLEIGTTQGRPADDLIDINKFRINSPAETERAWDQSEPPLEGQEILGCAVFPGYIDGAVRVIRTVQGAVSGATTRKVEFIYPGEILTRVYVRVHQVQGNIWQGYDLNESVASPVSDRALIYTDQEYGTQYYDEVDGTTSGSIGSPSPLGWYQMSSPKGSFLVFHGREQPGLLQRDGLGNPDYGSKYEDSLIQAWPLSFPAEYDEEVGERGVFSTQYPGITGGVLGSQNAFVCENPRGDGITMISEKILYLIDGGKASGDAGALEMTRRSRGVLSQCIAEEQRATVSKPGAPCIPSLSVSYGNDGGIVDLNISGCAQAAGWNVYQEMGGGVRKRLATMGPGSTFHDTTLSLNEQRTYSVGVLDATCVQGTVSPGVTLHHRDTVPPLAPESLSAITSTHGFELAWTVPASHDVSGYRVLISESPGGPYDQAHNNLLSAMNQSLDVQALAGATYYAVVQSVDHAGNESLPSPELRVTLCSGDERSGGVSRSSGGRQTVQFGRKPTGPVTGPCTGQIFRTP